MTTKFDTVEKNGSDFERECVKMRMDGEKLERTYQEIQDRIQSEQDNLRASLADLDGV